MAIKKEDFAKLRFNPFTKAKSIVEEYPQLARCMVFVDRPDINVSIPEAPAYLTDKEHEMLIRYVILTIEYENNPLANFDIEQRRREGIRLLEIKKGTLLYGEIERGGDALQIYSLQLFKIIHNRDYETWYSLKVSFHNTSMLLRSDPSSNPDDYAASIEKATKTIKVTREMLDPLEAKIFKDPNTKKTIADAVETAYFYAEKYAEYYL